MSLRILDALPAHSELALILGWILFLITMTTGIIFTSLMIRMSRRLGAMDKPDGVLKQHERSTATLGGIPLFAALTVGIVCLWVFNHFVQVEMLSLTRWQPAWIGVALSLLIILIIGIRDDLLQVIPLTKMLFQIVASLVLVSSGLVIYRCSFFGMGEIGLGLWAVPFTLFCLVGGCNAFNFIDGMDGLAAGVSTITAVILATLAFINGQIALAIICLILAGGLTGIWVFNYHPALIFLGDSGSQLIGLILGGLVLKICSQGGILAVPTAFLILSVPIMDTLLSIVRRYSRGQSPTLGDRNHVHHCLRRQGLSVPQSAAVLWVATFVFGCVAIIVHYLPGWPGCCLFAGVLIAQIYLGNRLNCINAGDIFAGLRHSFRKSKPASENPLTNSVIDLGSVWETMKPLFEKMKLSRAILTLEGMSEDGRVNYETYQWVRSEKEMAEFLSQQWTRRFTLDAQKKRYAILQLESSEQALTEEEHLDWLLREIRANMLKVQKQQQGSITRKTERELEKTIA